eukprot:1158805-Pelagomonas_calceolata.AAC.1
MLWATTRPLPYHFTYGLSLLTSCTFLPHGYHLPAPDVPDHMATIRLPLMCLTTWLPPACP